MRKSDRVWRFASYRPTLGKFDKDGEVEKHWGSEVQAVSRPAIPICEYQAYRGRVSRFIAHLLTVSRPRSYVASGDPPTEGGGRPAEAH
jgi:hypothetical protein